MLQRLQNDPVLRMSWGQTSAWAPEQGSCFHSIASVEVRGKDLSFTNMTLGESLIVSVFNLWAVMTKCYSLGN